MYLEVRRGSTVWYFLQVDIIISLKDAQKLRIITRNEEYEFSNIPVTVLEELDDYVFPGAKVFINLDNGTVGTIGVS